MRNAGTLNGTRRQSWVGVAYGSEHDRKTTTVLVEPKSGMAIAASRRAHRLQLAYKSQLPFIEKHSRDLIPIHHLGVDDLRNMAVSPCGRLGRRTFAARDSVYRKHGY